MSRGGRRRVSDLTRRVGSRVSTTLTRILSERWRQKLLGFARREGGELREGNAVVLYTRSGPYLAATRELIRASRRTLDVEMYIWADDAVGREISRLLAEAVERGVAVRILYDAVGCWEGTGHIERLAPGASVHAFNPVAPWRRHHSINHRNHRKLLIADDTVAVLGSGNWSKDYDTDANPGSFIDVGVAVSGPVVRDLALDFRKVWTHETEESLPPPQAPRPDIGLPGEPVLPVSAQVASGIKLGDRGAIRRLYGMLIGTAQREILLANAYFVPGARLLRGLRIAARRGLDVALVLPGQTDQRWVQAAARATYAPLIQAGAHVYERGERMLHAKVATLDGEVAVVGSANLDPRSFLHNLELNLNLRNPELAEALRGFIADQIAVSREVTLAELKAQPFLTRLWWRLAYSLRYWL